MRRQLLWQDPLRYGRSHMRLVRILALLLVMGALVLTGVVGKMRTAQGASSDWPMYLDNLQRTAAGSDTIISPSNAAQLAPHWTYKTGGAIAASPTVVNGTVYVGSWDGYEYALNATTGALQWRTFLGQTNDPQCAPPNVLGVSSGAAVQNGVVYVGGGDSYWYALDATSGAILWKVYTGDISPASGHYNWSSPLLYNGYAYIGVASLGDCPLVPGELLQVDLSSHQIVNTFKSVVDGETGGGIWTSPSVDTATNTIFVNTGTEANPFQTYSQAVVALDASTLAIKDLRRLPEAESTQNSDFSGSPILFSDAAGDPLMASRNNDGILFVFNRNSLHSGPIWQKQVAVDSTDYGTVSSAAFANGALYQAGGNTSINGAGYQGFVREIDPGSGQYLWEHGTPSVVVPAIAYSNGLIVDGEGSVLEVLNAATGVRLYSYDTGNIMYAAPSVSNGQILTGNNDGTIFAFGLPATQPPPPPPDPNCPSGWTCQDIGSPTPSGSETVSSGKWTVKAGGGGVGNTSDQFRFISQNTSGDSQISADVASQQTTSGPAQAGLMVRQTNDPALPNYAVFFAPGNKVVVQYRSAFGGGTTTVANVSTSALPRYLEIQRVGDRFLGGNLKQRGDLYACSRWHRHTGYASCCHGRGPHQFWHPGSRRYRCVQRGHDRLARHPSESSFSPDGLPEWLEVQRYREPGACGRSVAQFGYLDTEGGGHADRLLLGPVPLRVEVADGRWHGERTGGFADQHGPVGQGGCDAAAVDRRGLALLRGLRDAANGIVVQYRTSEGLNTTIMTEYAGTAPAYLEIARSGTTFSAYTSTDGVTWTYVIQSTVTLGISGTMLAGLAVSSQNAGVLGVATFKKVSIGTTAPPAPTACPSGWTCGDIGAALPVGTQTYSSGTWQVLGGGYDIWNASDEFYYASQQLSGDGSIQARVVSETNHGYPPAATDPWAKGGVMLRQSTDPGSPYYAVYMTPGNGIVVQDRTTQGGVASQLAAINGTAPTYLKVASSGGSFSAYTSPDGNTWTLIAGSTVNITMTYPLLAGLAITSHQQQVLTTATFDSVSINATTPPPPTCPTSWTCGDIGTPALAGNQSLSGGTWTVQGAGSDIWGTADQFHYVWQQLTADGSVSAQVLTQTNTDPWAKAGVMLRQSTDAGSPYYAAFVTPGNGITVQYRTTQGGQARSWLDSRDGADLPAGRAARASPSRLQLHRWGDLDACCRIDGHVRHDRTAAGGPGRDLAQRGQP